MFSLVEGPPATHRYPHLTQNWLGESGSVVALFYRPDVTFQVARRYLDYPLVITSLFTNSDSNVLRVLHFLTKRWKKNPVLLCAQSGCFTDEL
jgi:hypothetical protein